MMSIEREDTYMNITVTTYASVIACVQECNRSTLSFEQSSKNFTKSCSEATGRNVLRRISQMTGSSKRKQQPKKRRLLIHLKWYLIFLNQDVKIVL